MEHSNNQRGDGVVEALAFILALLIMAIIFLPMMYSHGQRSVMPVCEKSSVGQKLPGWECKENYSWEQVNDDSRSNPSTNR